MWDEGYEQFIGEVQGSRPVVKDSLKSEAKARTKAGEPQELPGNQQLGSKDLLFTLVGASSQNAPEVRRVLVRE